MNKFQKTEVLVAALTLTVFAAGTVFAAPPGPPPTPNAPSASFSSVTVAPTSGSGMSITGASGSPAVLATSPDTYGIQGSTSSTTAAGVYGVSGAGYGVIGVGNAANKAGVYGTSTNGYGIYGSSTNNNGVLGTAAGAFPSSGVYGHSTNSSGVGLYGLNSGAAGTGMGIYGYSGNNHGVFGYSNAKNGLWGQSNDATGTYSGVYGYNQLGTAINGSTISGTAGRFRNSGTGNTVNLATPTGALSATGNVNVIGNTTLSGNLDVQGFVQNTNGTLVLGDNIQVSGNSNFQNPVAVTSAGGSNIGLTVQGRIRSGDSANFGGLWVNSALTQFFGQFDATNLGIWNGGWWLRVSNTGAIDNPSGNLTFNDTVDLKGNVENSNNFWGFNWPVIIDDEFSVSGNATLNQNLTVAGHLQTASIGEIYQKGGPQVAAGTIPGNSTYALPAVLCNNPNHRVLSCRHSTGAGNGNTLVDAGSSIWGRTCIQYVRNISASTYWYDIVDAEAVCFDPNGSTW
ncbi:hypothetical protein IT412_02900 [Candidatus Peregrinibacteria bacterium]|nr:hypothetical protein [Candidatus Peregrinibacteria bacterium]